MKRGKKWQAKARAVHDGGKLVCVPLRGGNSAMNQEKVLDDHLVSLGEANEDEIEEEYNQKCLQMVSVSILLCVCST